MSKIVPNQQNLIIYNTIDGKVSVTMMARDGNVWMNQKQMAELFATSKQNIGQHIANILKENELDLNSVVKNYFITADDGKLYDVTFYSLDADQHKANILKENKLNKNSVIKDYLTTDADGKKTGYPVLHLDNQH